MCNYCHSLVDFAVSGCGKTWSEATEEGFTFQCLGCWNVDCLTAELARLTEIVKGMESGGRVIAWKTNGERTTGNMTCRKVTGEKVTVEKEGGTRGQDMREVDATGGKTNGRKEVTVDVTKRKSITRTMTGRKETGKKGTTEKAAGGKVSNQGDAKRRSYSEAVIEGALRTERVFMGDSILRKTDRTLTKGEDVVVCLPGARIEHVTERVENVLGHGQGGSILVHVGTNNADRDGTTRIVKRYRELVETLKKTRVEQIILSGILPVMSGRGVMYSNCKRMAINALLEQMCEEEGVGFVGIFCWERRYVYDRWPPFKRKGRSSVLREPASIDGQWNRLQLFKLVSQGGYTEKPNIRGINKKSKKKSAKNSLESPTEFGYKCVCLNARSIVNKRNELNNMVEDIDPHIIGITESWATPNISEAELGMTGYVMFRKDRLGRRGGGVILYIKESIQAYEIKLEKEAECEEAVWCNIVTGNSTLTVGLVYRSPNIRIEENEKIHNAIKEVSKRDCIIMGDFNHGHVQWTSLQSTGREDQEFLNLVQDSFLSQHVLEATRGENVLDIVLSS